MKRMKPDTFLLLCLLCCSLMGSCTSEEITADIRPSETGHVYLSLEFRQTNSPATRTDGDTKEDGTPAESFISNAKIILVSQSTGELTEIDENEIRWIQTDRDNVYQTFPIGLNVPDGTYRLYVITNATHADGSSFSPDISSVNNLTGAYSNFTATDLPGTKDACARFWAANHFVMTNVQNDISWETGVHNPTRGGIEINIKAGLYPINNPLPVSVNLDRIAVKVTAGAADGMESSFTGTGLEASDGNSYTFGEMTVDGTALLNCVTDFNLIQVWEKGERYGETGVERDMWLRTPSTETAPLYSRDHYYNRIPDFVSENRVTGLFTSPEAPMYCLENNSPYYKSIPGWENWGDKNATDLTKMKGRTTAVLFRVQAKLRPSAGAGNDLVRTFYRYNKTLYADIQALLNANAELSAAGLTPASTASDLRTAGVEVYENGYMYYIHWIADTNYTDKEYYHYYSVMRNTWYQLKVTGIREIGDDVPGGKEYEPTDPIDVIHNYDIVVSVTVRGWTIKDVSHPVEQ